VRLALAGVVAILVFATIGQFSHHGGVSVAGYAEDTLPFLVGWLLFTWRSGRFVPTWLLGVTWGVVVRAVVLSHYRWSELSFLVVALVFIGAVSGVLLLVARRVT
jgi:hypothetical protein